jgi:hypothetical protein
MSIWGRSWQVWVFFSWGVFTLFPQSKFSTRLPCVVRARWYEKSNWCINRYVRTVTVKDQGRSLQIRKSQLFGQKYITIPLSEAYTTKPAKTGYGDKGTEVPTPPNLSLVQRPFFLWNETILPMQVGGKTMRVDRDGDFTNVDVWDQMFYRKADSSSSPSKVK